MYVPSKVGAALAALFMCWNLPVLVADVQTTPIPPSQSAVFYLFCRLIADQSKNLAAAESTGQAAAQLQSILDRNGLSRTDWGIVKSSVESVLRELDRLAAERRVILDRSGNRPSAVDRNSLEQLDKQEKAALTQAMIALRARLSSAGQRGLDVLLNEVQKNIVGMRILVK